MPTYIKAGNPTDPVQWDRLLEAHMDITGAVHVEVSTGLIAGQKPVLWVNVDGVCVLRICQITNLVIPTEPAAS